MGLSPWSWTPQAEGTLEARGLGYREPFPIRNVPRRRAVDAVQRGGGLEQHVLLLLQ
jgi:hypothetical protein